MIGINVKDEPVNCGKSGLKSELLTIGHYHPHFHSNAIEIIYVLDGAVNIRSCISGRVLKKHDTFALDPGDIHYLCSDCDNTVLITHIVPMDIPDYIIDSSFFAFESSEMLPFQKQAMKDVKDMLLSDAMTSVGEKKKTEISRKIMNLFVRYFDWLSFMCNPDDPLGISQDRVRRIINYCTYNCEQKISIKDLAEMEHINENYFSVIMSKTNFRNFRTMLNFCRCYRAEKLLLTTELNIVEISFQCGFSDPKYFYAAFKSFFGCTPFQLRKDFKAICSKKDSFAEIDGRLKKKVLSEYIYDYFLINTLE